MTTSIADYITRRYDRWLDYALFQAAKAGIPDEAGDVLHEVLISLLQKDPVVIRDMLDRSKSGYTELDFFVLKMIKLNAHSMTSPYRHKTRDVPRDVNIDPWQVEILDEDPDEHDPKELLLEKWQRAREILEYIEAPDRDKEIFSWKFFADNPLQSWPGPESYSSACSVFNRTMESMYQHRDLTEREFRIRRFTRILLLIRSKSPRAA